jgi:hypothetical protein
METVSHSSEWTAQNEAHPWLKEKVYEPKRRRTVELVRQAVDSLVKRGQRVSLASVITESKKIDPEGRGVSKGGILGNPDAKTYYDPTSLGKVPHVARVLAVESKVSPQYNAALTPTGTPPGCGTALLGRARMNS